MPGILFGLMNSKQLSISLAALVIGLALIGYFLSDPLAPTINTTATMDAAFTPPTQTLAPNSGDHAGSIANYADATQRLGNPLERSEDLQATYRQFKDSKDPLERHIAFRAWSACFPTFIAPQGQSISIESITSTLPENDPSSAMRIEAYRNLLGRCKNFSHMSRADTLSITQRQQEASNKGVIFSPGEMAAKHQAEGKQAEAMQLAREIITSQDPFSISSLREFINQIGVAQVDAQSTHSEQRPDLHSLAFAFAACQMGMDCSAGSLTAIQMCASMGECSGSLTDRYRHSMPNQADREALEREAQKVLDAIRSKNFKALGL